MSVLFVDKIEMKDHLQKYHMDKQIGFFRLFFLFIGLIFFSKPIYSQNVDIYNFQQFESILNQKNDTVYVINFWATWCAPCVKELPDFQKIHEKYDGQNFKMILVSLDFRKQLDTRLKPFIRDRALSPEVILLHEPDANSWIDQVDPRWSGAIPATLIFNKEKRIFREGEFTFEELDVIMQDYGLKDSILKNIKP